MNQMSTSPEDADEPPFLSVEQVARRYDVSTDSIWRWARKKKFPAPVRVGGGTTRWRRADIIEHDGALKCCFTTSLMFSLAA